MFPNENVGTVPPVVKSAVPVRRGRAALVPSADNPDLSMKIASTTQVIKCILSFFQVCRAAVICVCEMFVKLRRSMEQDLEKIALPLIAKTGEEMYSKNLPNVKIFGSLFRNVTLFCKTATMLDIQST